MIDNYRDMTEIVYALLGRGYDGILLAAAELDAIRVAIGQFEPDYGLLVDGQSPSV